MYRLYIHALSTKRYIQCFSKMAFLEDMVNATQFCTIESANSKAHEMNLNEYFIEDEHGQTVYPMKPEVDNLNVICKTQHEQTK